jgi:hypothetical protein
MGALGGILEERNWISSINCEEKYAPGKWIH